MRTASEILAEDPAPAAAASEILEELQAAAHRLQIRQPAADQMRGSSGNDARAVRSCGRKTTEILSPKK